MDQGHNDFPPGRNEPLSYAEPTHDNFFKVHHERLLRLAGWGAIVAITVLSLIPATRRPATGMSGHLEHLIAYFGAALVLGLGARELGRVMRVGLLLTGYAGVLEVVQLWVPGRHAKLSDFVTSTTGILIGCVVVAVFILSTHRWQESLYAHLLRIVCRRTWKSRDE